MRYAGLAEKLSRLRRTLPLLTDEEQAEALASIGEIARLVDIFMPNPGPQTEAADSEADIIGYGGAAGGGKSMLVSGLALTQHTRSLIIRQQKTQTNKFVQDISGILGGRDGYSSQNSAWVTADGRLIEFGGLDNDGDEEKWQGRDHDLKAFDEATQMREAQVRYIAGWNRTDIVGQRCRTLLTFNPPTTAEGRWVIRFFAPWIDPKYAGQKAADGELRWFATIGNNADYELPIERKGEPFVVIDGEPVYDFDPAGYTVEDIVNPKSRTFITARLSDNPYYMATGYMSQLQQLPEPLRSQMLRGDFSAGVEDGEYQLIPTTWIEAAMDRWRPHDPMSGPLPPMDSMGVDAARGGNMGATLGVAGKDKMIISRRHGRWFAPLIAIKGIDVNSGSLAATQVIRYRTDGAPVHVDVIGVGTSVYDFLAENHVHTIPMNGSAKSGEMEKANVLAFRNRRAEWWWRFMEALNPENPEPIALPDDAELLADLAAPLYSVTAQGILIESKDDIKKRLKRSPDKGDAVVYANASTPKRQTVIGPLSVDPSSLAGMRSMDADSSRYDELK